MAGRTLKSVIWVNPVQPVSDAVPTMGGWLTGFCLNHKPDAHTYSTQSNTARSM